MAATKKSQTTKISLVKKNPLLVVIVALAVGAIGGYVIGTSSAATKSVASCTVVPTSGKLTDTFYAMTSGLPTGQTSIGMSVQNLGTGAFVATSIITQNNGYGQFPFNTPAQAGSYRVRFDQKVHKQTQVLATCDFTVTQ